MNARQLIEAETPQSVFKQIATPANRNAQVVAEMGFKSKDEVDIGRRVLWRRGPGGWDQKADQYYAITGADWHRVGAFYCVPPGKDVSSYNARECPKEQSTHLHLGGVGHSYPTWEEFFARAVKPELYYPRMKMQGMPFNRPPDQRY